MTPYSAGQDVFRTQADARFNSFADPMNPVNMNPGNWGINSAYMTPSYMSPYRPQYQGPQGNMYGGSNPSWAASANYIANPFRAGGDNYGGNYWQQSTPFYNSIINRPMDQTASFMQNWGVPMAAGYGAYRMLGGFGSRIGTSIGQGLVGGAAGRFFQAGTAASLGKFGGAIGGLAGSFAIPGMAASAAVSAFDGAIMDPYVAQRQMSNNMRSNFAGVTFGGHGVGDPYQGGGMSRTYASNISRSMSQFAAKDLTFNQKEVSQLSDYSARAGLLDSVNPEQFASKMKDITRQVKLVMSVANTSDFKEAIEILGKMQSAGATGGTASRMLSRLGSSAAIGGISTQQLMNTVGMQGQYLFGAAGLTPYVGQMAAGSAYGSMASAFRSGLLSPALAARMGGVEGATQSSVAGMLGMAQSPYAAMYAHNGYLGGGETGSIVGNISRFGGGIARGGLSAIGEFNLARPALASRLTEERGLQSTQQMLYQLARTTPGAMKNGKMTAGSAYEMMTGAFGLTDDQSRAMLEQFRSFQDPRAVQQMLAGNQRSMVDNRLKFMQQHGADYGMFTPMVQSVLGLGRSAQNLGAGMVGAGLVAAGGIGDSTQSWWNEAKFGKTADMQALKFNSEDTITTLKTGKKGGRLNSFKDIHTTHLDKLNQLAKQGDKDAIKAITGKGVEQRDAIYNLASQGKIDKHLMGSSDMDKLIGAMNSAGTETLKNTGQGVKDVLGEVYGGSKLSAGNSVIDNNIIFRASETLLTTTEDSAEWNKARKQLQEVYGKDLSKDEIAKIINSDSIKSMQMNGANAHDFGTLLGVKNEGELNQLSAKYGGYENMAKQKYGLSGKSLEKFKTNSKTMGEGTALAMALQEQSGGDLRGAKLDETRLSHLSNSERAALLNGEMETNKQRQFITQMAKDHKIDFNTYNQNLSALDNKESISAFSDAVSRFSDAVDKSGSTGKKTANEIHLQMRTGVRTAGN